MRHVAHAGRHGLLRHLGSPLARLKRNVTFIAVSLLVPLVALGALAVPPRIAQGVAAPLWNAIASPLAEVPTHHIFRPPGDPAASLAKIEDERAHPGEELKVTAAANVSGVKRTSGAPEGDGSESDGAASGGFVTGGDDDEAAGEAASGVGDIGDAGEASDPDEERGGGHRDGPGTGHDDDDRPDHGDGHDDGNEGHAGDGDGASDGGDAEGEENRGAGNGPENGIGNENDNGKGHGNGNPNGNGNEQDEGPGNAHGRHGAPGNDHGNDDDHPRQDGRGGRHTSGRRSRRVHAQRGRGECR